MRQTRLHKNRPIARLAVDSEQHFAIFLATPAEEVLVPALMNLAEPLFLRRNQRY